MSRAVIRRDYGHSAHHVKMGNSPFARAAGVGEVPPMPRKSPIPGSLPDRIAVARQLVALRYALKLRKAELADSLRCDRRTWGLYESAERDLPLAVAWRLYRRYGVTLDFTYDGKLHGVPSHLRDDVLHSLNNPPDQLAS